MACSLALLRIELIDIWERYHVLVKVSLLDSAQGEGQNRYHGESVRSKF